MTTQNNKVMEVTWLKHLTGIIDNALTSSKVITNSSRLPGKTENFSSKYSEV